jgi:hypothetical protein
MAQLTLFPSFPAALLGPLLAASDLPQHPALSLPYKSSVLPGMVQQACDMVHHEKRTLLDFKRLLTIFRGDQPWIPCSEFWAEDDVLLFAPSTVDEQGIIVTQMPQTNGDGSRPDVKIDGDMQATDRENRAEDVGVTDREAKLEPAPPNHVPADTADAPVERSPLAQAGEEDDLQQTDNEPPRDPMADRAATASVSDASRAVGAPERASNVPDEDAMGGDGQDKSDLGHETSNTRMALDRDDVGGNGQAEDGPEGVEEAAPRMRTRAQAQAASEQAHSDSRTLSPDPSIPPLIHPLYRVPASSLPDRDFGLPGPEAEETRRILMAWVQKQEEVVRRAEQMYQGLLKANRLRKTVYSWCKAEGHVGEMSDGEDWYDKEEWGLEQDLEKGKHEEEDESINHGKKTRGRRGAQ